jgi:hypothetical protein
MEVTVRPNLRSLLALIVLALACLTPGCSSDPPPPPDLTPPLARDIISRKWAQEELNHFRVTFHSDRLIECGVENDLWKLAEIKDSNGNAWSTAYRLTEKGTRVVHSIDLKESGRGHEIVLRGPYQTEITSITDGAQPTNKRVGFRWQIDWDKASDDLKACLPRFELSGSELALFELNDNNWRFASYLNPADAPPAQAAGSVMDKLH